MLVVSFVGPTLFGLVERIRKAIREWRHGRRSDYPICCVSWFCFAHFVGAKNLCRRAGKVRRPNSSIYVPCIYHRHHKPAGWEPHGVRWIEHELFQARQHGWRGTVTSRYETQAQHDDRIASYRNSVHIDEVKRWFITMATGGQVEATPLAADDREFPLDLEVKLAIARWLNGCGPDEGIKARYVYAFVERAALELEWRPPLHKRISRLDPDGRTLEFEDGSKIQSSSRWREVYGK